MKPNKLIKFFCVISVLVVSISIKDITIGYILADNELANQTVLNVLEDDVFGGYSLFILERKDQFLDETVNRTLMITDLDGNIYFQREISTEGSLATGAVRFYNSTTLIYGDVYGTHLWNLETDITQFLDVYKHHDFEVNYANDTYFGLSNYKYINDSIEYSFDIIKEVTANGTEVWSKDLRDFVDLSSWCPYEDGDYYDRDMTHSNTLCYDEQEDVIYVNCKNLNTFYKIDHKTGELIWGVGEYGNFTLFDRNGNPASNLFYHAHSLELIDNKTFIIFDNDYHNQTDATNLLSRMVEITIDETKMYANTTWDWAGGKDYFCIYWGDANRLPNNNRLGTFGTHGHPESDLSARMVEVNTEGNIVWELTFPKVNSETFGMYRSERFRFAPIVSDPVFVDLGSNDSYIEWDVWYNFNSRTRFTGTYYISVDGETVESDSITFPRFWQSTQMKYFVDISDVEQHEISLVVSDEAGHLSNETALYSSTGLLSVKPLNNRALIISLSVTAGSVVLLSFGVIIWFKYGNDILARMKKILRR